MKTRGSHGFKSYVETVLLTAGIDSKIPRHVRLELFNFFIKNITFLAIFFSFSIKMLFKLSHFRFQRLFLICKNLKYFINLFF